MGRVFGEEVKGRGKIVDFRNGWWGHSITYGQNGRTVVYCTPALNKGDQIMTKMGDFIVTDVEDPGYGPKDMQYVKCESVG